jgi:glycosyltransferase involved in cell wall biosynthesis
MNQLQDAGGAAPAVTIGIPVYNGERYLEEAIRSVLAQTRRDLELVISDNASTDRTPEICRDYALQDGRVRYFRNPTNLGAAPNYNLAFTYARGRFFKWLAHDDLITPTFAEKATHVLGARPDAVMCNSVVSYIDSKGAPLGLYDTQLGRADVASPSRRLAQVTLPSHSCVDFFGMFRRSALEGSLLHGSFHGADRALLAQMSLRGRMIQIPEPLVQMREHENRYTRSQLRAADRAAWHNTQARGRVSFPTWRLYIEYLKMVRAAQLGSGELMRCYAVLARWWTVNWNIARAAVDVVAIVAPGVPGVAERIKTRLFGAAPGHLIAARRR